MSKSQIVNINKLSDAIKNLNIQEAITLLRTKGVADAEITATLATKGYTESTIEEALASNATAVAQNVNAVSSFTLSGAINTLTASIKANIIAMWTWMTTTPLGIITAIGIAIIGVVSIIDLCNVSLKEHKEKLSKVRQEYKDTISTLENLNSTLKENIDRIDELQLKAKNGTISLIEQDELNKLKTNNKLLKEKIALEKEEADKKAKETVIQSRKTYNKQFGKINIEDEISDNQNYYTASNSQYKSDSKADDYMINIKVLDNSIKAYLKDGNIKMADELDKQRQQYVDKLNAIFTEEMSDLNGYQQDLLLVMNDDGTFNNKLDQAMWNNIESWKKHFYQYSDQSGEWNSLQIESLMDDFNIQNITDKFVNKINIGYKINQDDIQGVQMLTKAFDELDFILEEGQTPISLYIQYCKSLSEEAQKAGTVITELKNQFIFESNNDAIDKYQDSISDLMEAYQKLQDGTLNLNDKIDLFQMYPEFSDADNLEDAITKKIQDIKDDILTLLKENGATDDIISLFDNVDISNIGIDSYISSIRDVQSVINEAKEDMESFGRISSDTIQNIASSYPDLSDAVTDYLRGKIKEQDILDKLQDKYQQDLKNYSNYVLQKERNDKDFYDELKRNISNDLKTRLLAYGYDLSNYATYSELKKAMDSQTGINTSMIDKNQTQYEASLKDTPQEEFYYDEINKYKNRQLQNEELIKAIQDMMYNEDFFEKLQSSDNDTSSSQTNNYFDWISNSIGNAQSELDKFNDSLEQSKSFNERITAYNNLIKANDKFIAVLNRAQDAYKIEWNKKSSSINKEYIDKIMSKQTFNIEDFTGREELYDKIVEAQDAYKDWQDTINQHDEAVLQQQTYQTDKVKLYKEQQESNLSNLQLNVEMAVSAKRKNQLLDKEIDIKKSILNYDLLLVETDEEKIRLQLEYNKYLKDNANTQYENTKSEIDNKIEYYSDMDTKNQNKRDLLDTQGVIVPASLYENSNYYLSQQVELYKQEVENAQTLRDQTEYMSDEWCKYNEDLNTANDNINKCTISQIENNKAIASIPLKVLENQTKELESQLKFQQNIKDATTTAISSASDYVQDQIDYYNDLKEATEKTYNTQMDLIQDKIDAMTKENDAQQRQMDLEKAKYNLDKALNQKTVKIYREGQGFVYEADQQAIQDAQEAYDKTLFNNNVEELNSQKTQLEEQRDLETEGIDKQITSLTLYQEALNQITDTWQKAYDIQILMSNFGGDALDRILNGDMSLIGEMSTVYNQVGTSVQTLQEQIDQNNDTLDTANQFIESWNGATKELPSIINHIGNLIKNNSAMDEAIDAKNTKVQTLANQWSTNNISIKNELDTLNQNYSTTGDTESIILEKRLSAIKAFAREAKEALSSVESQLSPTEQKVGVKVVNNGAGGADVKSIIGTSHSGMKLGYIRKDMPEGTSSQDAFTTLSLRKLRDDEIPRILQVGEAVLNKDNQQNILANMTNSFLSGMSSVPINHIDNTSKTFEFNGDIVITNPIGDVDGLAKKIKSEFLTRMDQNLYKN